MEFKVHERVRVRDWDEMVEEFGIYEDGINTPHLIFISEMRKFCGKTYEIKQILGFSDYIDMTLEGAVDLETLPNISYHFTSDMVEKVEEEEENKSAFSLDEWNSLMGGV